MDKKYLYIIVAIDEDLPIVIPLFSDALYSEDEIKELPEIKEALEFCQYSVMKNNNKQALSFG